MTYRWYVVGFLAILAGFEATAQDSSGVWVAEPGSPQFLAVLVEDVDESVAWYRTAFGLQVLDGSEAEDGSWRIVNLSRQGLFVEIIRDDRAQEVERARGFFKVGFAVPDVDVIADRVMRATKERPSVVDDVDHGQRILQLKDPDGNTIQLFSPLANQPEHVSFPTEDGGVVHADMYGKSGRGVVLAHGGRFTKESWTTQAQVLAKAGFRVLAIDFRGRGQSRGGSQPSSHDDVRFDVLAAVRYLRETGADSVSVVGGSFGGWATAQAAVEAGEGEIDRIVLLAAAAIDEPERMQGRKLFITTRDDFRGGGTLRLPEIRDQYERATEPKQLVILEGSAHAQHIFGTDQGERLMSEILRFLSEQRYGKEN